MNKNYVLDLFGVLRSLGWACVATAMLFVALGLFTVSLGGSMFGSPAVTVASLSAILGAVGAVLVMVASLTRWLVARMRFHSEQPRPAGG